MPCWYDLNEVAYGTIKSCMAAGPIKYYIMYKLGIPCHRECLHLESHDVIEYMNFGYLITLK